MHFEHWVAIFHELPWLSQTKVFYKKLQRSAVNACGNRMCQLSFTFFDPKEARTLLKYNYLCLISKIFWTVKNNKHFLNI